MLKKKRIIAIALVAMLLFAFVGNALAATTYTTATKTWSGGTCTSYFKTANSVSMPNTTNYSWIKAYVTVSKCFFSPGGVYQEKLKAAPSTPGGALAGSTSVDIYRGETKTASVNATGQSYATLHVRIINPYNGVISPVPNLDSAGSFYYTYGLVA